ncbi:hypothetical protein [Infirmifilum sp. SLHALR2]|nr:MAG: hypothetical protein B7L53_09735 [Thermofilum sp. NZ13]
MSITGRPFKDRRLDQPAAQPQAPAAQPQGTTVLQPTVVLPQPQPQPSPQVPEGYVSREAVEKFIQELKSLGLDTTWIQSYLNELDKVNEEIERIMQEEQRLREERRKLEARRDRILSILKKVSV